MKEIICPVDFSSTSKAALNYAAALANHFSAQLTIIHVYELPVLYGDAPFLAVQQLGADMEESARKNLNLEAERIKTTFAQIVIEKILVCGIPSIEILKIADRRKADILVMGTKGLNALERLFIGSTSERVFHHASMPVLCIPEHATYKGIHKIVFATDLKEDNLEAAMAITPFAKSFGAELEFVYIDTEHTVSHEELSAELTEKIRTHIKYPCLAGFVTDDFNVTAGLHTFLQKYPADVLVMFTHQRNFPRSLTSPSVTSRTMHHLGTPMLVLTQSKKG